MTVLSAVHSVVRYYHIQSTVRVIINRSVAVGKLCSTGGKVSF